MSHPKTIRMKKADAEKWLSALRSGEYKQGLEALKSPDGSYCCLGVLQHCLAGKTERAKSGKDRGLPSQAWMLEHGIETLDTPNRGGIIANCMEGDDAAPIVYHNEHESRLHELNDEGYSFNEIADLIEQSVEYTDDNQ